MKETYYFSHDYNASQDPKIMSLVAKCGLSGIGMYWILIEILHQQPESKINREIYDDYIDFYGRIDAENEHLLNKIKDVLIDVGLFVEQDGFIFSKRVLENKKQREILSEKRSFAGKKSAEARRNNTSVEQVLNKRQQGKERKGKERKDNNSEPSSLISENQLSLNDLYGKLGLPEKPKRQVNKWQDEAANAVQYFSDGQTKASSIFKCFRDNNSKAKIAFSDCKELEKKSVMYFLKVFNELSKK